MPKYHHKNIFSTKIQLSSPYQFQLLVADKTFMVVAIDTDKEGRCVSSHLPLLIYCPLQIHNFKLIFCMFVELAVITRIILSPTSRNLAEYSRIQSWLKFNKTNKKGAQCLCSVIHVLATLD